MHAFTILMCVMFLSFITVFLCPSWLLFVIGEVVAIPLPCTITSIWPLPFGLLLQQAGEGEFPANVCSTSSNLLFGVSGIASPRREFGQSPRDNSNIVSPLTTSMKLSGALSSHLILRDIMSEPEVKFQQCCTKVSFNFSF